MATFEQFASAAWDLYPAHIAIVNQHGEIIFVNQAWRQSAESQCTKSIVDKSIKYLAVCLNAEDHSTAQQFALGIRAVLAGHQPLFTLEYPCYSPIEEHWFIGKVFRLEVDNQPYAIIIHEDITHQRESHHTPAMLESTYQIEKRLSPKHIITQFAAQVATAPDKAHLFEEAQKIAIQEERQRLARDLHDAVSQILFASMNIAQSIPLLWQKDPEVVLNHINQIVILNKAAMAEMRTLLLDLRPEALTKTDLPSLIRQLVEAALGHKRIEISFTYDPILITRLPADVHIAFYRIAQESLNNAIKHSRATQLDMALNLQDQAVRLDIQDNGVGFDSGNKYSGMGMSTMQERAESINAALTVSSQVGAGTQVALVWSGAVN